MKSVIDILKAEKLSYSINYFNSYSKKYEIIVIQNKTFQELKNKVKDIKNKHIVIDIKEFNSFLSVKSFI